jgi:hypothetical protein
MGDMRNRYKILVRKPETKKPVGSPRREWEDDIKIVLIEIRSESVDWILLSQDSCQLPPLVNTVSLRGWGDFLTC